MPDIWSVTVTLYSPGWLISQNIALLLRGMYIP